MKKIAPQPVTSQLASDYNTANNAHAAAQPQTTHQQSWVYVLLPYTILLLVALVPRLLDLGLFLDSDERNFWLDRSLEWLRALQAGDPAATAISTHPGVTTMWLGTVGIWLRRSLLEWGLLDAMPFPTLLTLMRLPVVLTHTAVLLVGFAVLRRLFPLPLAFLAALLWAADPFVVAYSRILHVDGLATSFATLSLLAACLFWHHSRRHWALLLSAAAAALAVLSKSPALAVLPIIGLAGLLAPLPTLSSNWRASLWARFWPLLLWGAVFGTTIVLVWPAVWADPAAVYHLLRLGVEVEGSSPHVVGNFFLGQADPAPGPLYYPVALALRTTPITLVGLLLLPLFWWRHPSPSATHRDLALLAAYMLLFVGAMSLFDKKLNRYVVPTFPALDVLAAAGLYWAYVWGSSRLGRSGSARTAVSGTTVRWVAVALVALLAVANVAHWHPYPVVAFNQLFGGAPAGAQTFLLGDGEGLNEAADWLHAQPNITGVTIASTMIHSFQPYLHRGVQSVSPDAELSEQVGYVLVYLRHTQRGPLWPPFEQFYPERPPLHTVTLHGIEYVWLYEVPPPIEQRVDIRFEPGVSLLGYELDTTPITSTGMLQLTTQWRTDQPLQQNYLLFAHLLDRNGQRISQADVPPGGPDAPTSAWEVSRSVTWVHPLPVPTDLPPGDYWIALGLYDPADPAARLPWQGEVAPPADAPDAGRNALLLPIQLPSEPAP